jgi:signal transduction histidine kinase
MNSASISHPSLYQITQQYSSPLPFIIISSLTFKSYLKTLFNLLTESEAETKVWLKLPQTKSWLNIIDKYRLQNLNTKIYSCNHCQENFSDLNKNQNINRTSIIPFQLTNKEQFKKESFLIVSSPQFSVLILAQWQKGKVAREDSSKRLQQPHLKLVCSFTSETIRQILVTIQQAIAVTDKQQIITEEDINLISQNKNSFQLVTQLLLKQIESTELLHKSNDLVPPSPAKILSLSQSLQLEGEFLHHLIRELRSPITHMKTALSLLESKQIKGEQRQRYLQMLSYECERQNSLISGLLELLQLENYPETESSVCIRLDELVPGIVSTYQPLAKEKDIQLGYTIPSQLPSVACPSSWLRQIIINLLNNSLQFTSANGRVFVEASLKEDNVELIVSDTGVGIETKELTKIFDSFYRGKTAISEQITGAGLGLTIVRQLVERCGGSISVSSKIDKGSIFKIILPTVLPELIEEA